MSRPRKGREVSGWLGLDKPAGRTSTDMVGAVKRLFSAAKVGHAGTLDPLATGVLPIALGEATKTVSFVQDGRKVYRFTLRWGIQTNTDDAEGSPVATSDARPEEAALHEALGEFIGELVQRPPAFSAVKIDGNRAYDLARAGEAVETAERQVTVHRLAVIAVPDADHAILEAECGKGTYVRALARDLGRRLGTYAHVVALRRLTVGPFDEPSLVTLETLIEAREASGAETLDRFLRPISFVLGALPEIKFAPGDAAHVRRGQAVLLRGRDAPVLSGPVHATYAGESLAVGEVAEGSFHPRRVFNT
jgi:tRNA pseudouridine55 synthase